MKNTAPTSANMKGARSMRIAKEQVDVKMSIPGAIIRQRTDFGDATGYGKTSG